jgi:3-deoxy-7-phosphoheptulonate synthase
MTQSTTDLNILKVEPLIPPDELQRKYPVTPKIAETVIEGRKSVQAILRGDDPRMLVIIGPCSIHDEEAALEYAGRLKKLTDSVADRILIVMRVYFEKPRTTLGWKGLINDPSLDGTFDVTSGLHRARKLLMDLAEMELLSATEFLDPIVPQYIADLVSWAAIGARTTESQMHREMASGLSMPVGFKNGTDGNSQIAVDAMKTSRAGHSFLGIDMQGRNCVIRTSGNAYSHLILRGGTGGANYEAAEVAAVQAQLTNAGLPPRLMVDCSHANSEKDFTRQGIAFRDVVEQRIAGNGDVVGLMVESNINPGNQPLGDDPSKLAYGVSITDACIGWDETETLLTEAHSRLSAVAQPVS